MIGTPFGSQGDSLGQTTGGVICDITLLADSEEEDPFDGLFLEDDRMGCTVLEESLQPTSQGSLPADVQ